MLILLIYFVPADISEISETPPVLKGVYLSPGVVHSGSGVDEFFRMCELGLLNTAVLDVKDVKGRIMFTLYDEFIKKAKKKGIYLIARQCVFKDKYYAFRENGKNALKDEEGNIWFEERAGYWTDPSKGEVRKYNLRIMERAYERGFNEVQFDYIRYPSGKKLYRNSANKLHNLLVFLDSASKKVPECKHLSITLYGYAIWGKVLLREGQNLEEMSERVDAVYPMLYPSHFRDNFMNDSTEEWRTYSIVYESIQKARKRLKDSNIRIISYIQAFNWKQSRMGKKYIKNQIKAVYESDGDGFVMWEAGGDYSRAYDELIDFDIELSGRKLEFAEIENNSFFGIYED